MRHDEVTVLECGDVAGRDFPEWSMAYAGGGQEAAVEKAGLSLAQALQNQSTAAGDISELLRTLVLQDDYIAV